MASRRIQDKPAQSLSTFLQIQPNREMELQKMLADERIRCEKHKVNYQTLKDEHTRLQEEYLSLQRDMKQTLEKSKEMKDSSEIVLEKVQKIISEKQNEIDELKLKMVMNNPEAMKQKLLEEMEKKYKEYCQQLESEVDHYREQYNTVHYDYTVLKCQQNYSETEYKRISEELKLKYQGELAQLQKEINAFREQKNASGEKDGFKLRNVQRENAQLQQKVKSLLTELEELRAQCDKSNAQAENAARIQGRQLTEHAANIRTLESEKVTVQMQKEVLQKELMTVQEDKKSLTSQLHAAKEENLKLKSHLEEVIHKAQLESANLQIESVRKKGEVERERDRFAAELTNLKLDLESAKETIEKQKQALEVKDQDIQVKIHLSSQQVWEKYHQLNSEKRQLESKLKDIENSKREVEANLQHDLEKSNQKLKAAVEAKQSIENDALILRRKLGGVQNDLKSVEEYHKENSSLKEECYSLKQRISELTSVQTELLQQREKLKSAVTEVHQKLEALKSEATKSKEIEQKSFLQHQLNWEQEKQLYQRRTEELQSHIGELNAKSLKENQELKQKVKKYSQLINKLRDKMQLLKAESEHMEIERQVLRKYIPPEVHMQQKKKLLDLQRRHEEFHQVMAAALAHIPSEDLQGIGNPLQALLTPPMPTFSTTVYQDNAADGIDMQSLKARLDQLERQQQSQLKEFGHFTSKISRTKIKQRAKKDELETPSSSDLDHL